MERQVKPMERQVKPMERQVKPMERQVKPMETQVKPMERQANADLCCKSFWRPGAVLVLLIFAAKAAGVQAPCLFCRFLLQKLLASRRRGRFADFAAKAAGV